MLIALIMRTHFELLTQLQIGLTPQLLQMAPRMANAGDFLRMLQPSDILFLASPPAIFFLALVCAGPVRRIYKPFAAVLTAAILALQLLPTHIALTWEIAHHPVLYLVDNLVRNFKNAHMAGGNFYSRRGDLPGAAQMNSICLIDPAFGGTYDNFVPPPLASALAPDGQRWNILIFVMESTGADYVFDDSQDRPTPMPFLKKICGQGLSLSNHFASANTSALAAFSIFTGLYPPTNPGSTCMEANLDIPTLNYYLGPGYDYFWVQPCQPTFWFPEFLFVNNGLKEMNSMVNLPAGIHPDLTEEARNELDCFDFLQSRLDRAHEPFLAVYWSFIPHYPYSDYGPDSRIRLDLTNRRDLYYNNLRVLDDQIHRIWQHLEENGVADHTLFVFLGDHGEAFGQHGTFGHGLGSYDETYRVPVVFWQPKLIKPQVIKFPTSHVDILPTLLDLLGLRYDPSRFQGDSVLRGVPNRKYIFMMDELVDCISAITPDMKKVTLSFNNNVSTVFNLATDPAEKNPLNQIDFPGEIEAILKFRNYQAQMIPNYNHARLSGDRYPPPKLRP